MRYYAHLEVSSLYLSSQDSCNFFRFQSFRKHLLMLALATILLCVVPSNTCQFTTHSHTTLRVSSSPASTLDGKSTDSPLDYSSQPSVHIPEEWFCKPEHYNSRDGCHCLCGAHDPDCDNTPVNQIVSRSASTNHVLDGSIQSTPRTVSAINCPCPEQQLLILLPI